MRCSLILFFSLSLSFIYVLANQIQQRCRIDIMHKFTCIYSLYRLIYVFIFYLSYNQQSRIFYVTDNKSYVFLVSSDNFCVLCDDSIIIIVIIKTTRNNFFGRKIINLFQMVTVTEKQHVTVTWTIAICYVLVVIDSLISFHVFRL